MSSEMEAQEYYTYIYVCVFYVYLSDVSRCVVCNILLKRGLVASLVCLLGLEKLNCRSSTSNFNKNPVVFGEHLGRFFGQLCISLHWLKSPQHHSSLFSNKP